MNQPSSTATSSALAEKRPSKKLPRAFLEFDLDISQNSEGFVARVLNSPKGQAVNNFCLPFTDAQVADGLQLVGGQLRNLALLSSDNPSSTLPNDPRSFGKTLFESVFAGEVGDVFARSLDEAKKREAGLRIRLRLNQAPTLAGLPWEYLYDPRRRRYLCRSSQTPLVRYLELAEEQTPLLVELPLRILVVLSDPIDVGPKLNVEGEWQRLEAELQPLLKEKKVEVERLEIATIAELRKRFRQDQNIHILHLICHGTFDPVQQTGALLLEDKDGNGKLVSAETLCEILGDRPPRLVFLNACDSARTALGDAFSGTAQQLVQQGTPAVIAMQFEISDGAAINLAQEFYGALAEGYPVDAALAEARKAVSADGSVMEWGTPVLFMRSPDGYLFDVDAWLPTPACPYPGMSPFSQPFVDKFYGREREIDEAVRKLRSHPFLTVIGPSGVGKSSLVLAGILPRLTRLLCADKEESSVKSMRPGERPLNTLIDTLQLPRASGQDATSVQWDTWTPSQNKLVLIVDQFEELFTLSRKEERSPFQEALAQLDRYLNLYVILTVRADFYHELLTSPLWGKIKTHRLELKPLSDDGLRQAIVKPAEAVDVELDPALVERLLADAADEPGVMPLIQETLVLLWEQVKRRRLSLAVYTALTGDDGKRNALQVAIAERADTVMSKLTQSVGEPAQRLARRIFLRLVQFGEGRPDTRRHQPLKLLQATGDDPQIFAQTLKHLSNARLLTASGSEKETEAGVDIAHEALILGWPTFQEWLNESRRAEQKRRRLEAKATEWLERERQGAFLDKVELGDAQKWLASDAAQEVGYSTTVIELTAASHKVIRRNRFLALAAVAIPLLILLLAWGIYGLKQLSFEDDQKRSTARALGNSIHQLLTLDPANGMEASTIASALSVLPSAENPQPYVPEAESALLQAVMVNLERNSFQLPAPPTSAQIAAGPHWIVGGVEQLWRIDYAITRPLTLTGQIEPIRAVQWNQAGDQFLLRNRHSVQVWNEQGLVDQQSLGQEEATCAEWQPQQDGLLLCSGETLRLWSISEKTLSKLHVFSETVTSVRWSPTGRYLAAWDDVTTNGPISQTLLFWDSGSGLTQAVARNLLTLHLPAATQLKRGAWSPDGRFFVGATRGKELWIWDMADPTLGQQIPVAGRVEGIEFVDAENFVTWSLRDLTRRWTVAGAMRQEYGATTDAVQDVQFSPNQEKMLIFLATGGASLWDVASGEQVTTLCCHDKPISSAIWRDARYLATVGKDGQVLIWDLAAESEDEAKILTLRGHKSRNRSGRANIFGAHWVDAQTLLTYGDDGAFHHWQIFDEMSAPLCNGVDERRIPRCYQFSQPFALDGSVNGVRWIDNDHFVTTLITTSESVAQRVSLSRAEVLTHAYPITNPTQLVWSLDGNSLLMFTPAGGVQVRDFASNQPIFTHTQPVAKAMAVTGGFLIHQTNGDALLFQSASGATLALQGEVGLLTAAALSQDGRLATAEENGTIHIWSLIDGSKISNFGADVPLAEQIPVWELRWTADGQSLLAAGRKVACWDVATGQARWVTNDAGFLAHLDLTPDDRLVAVAIDRRIFIFDVNSGKQIDENHEHEAGIVGLRWVQAAHWPNQDRNGWLLGALSRLFFAPTAPRYDERYDERLLLITWSADGTARVWDWQNDLEILRFTEDGSIVAADISPDGSQIVTAAVRATGGSVDLRLWQTWLQDPVALLEVAQHRAFNHK